MAIFKSWLSYNNFRKMVLREQRYFRSTELDDFLLTVWETSKGREQILSAGTVLWRAQEGSDEESETLSAFPPARMKPLSHVAIEGRANPKGIPCLYLATNKETAMSEVRPWVGAYVSLSQLETKRQLKILNFANTTSDKTIIHLEEPEPAAREQAVWSAIDIAFSTPITNSDNTADYVPTQILAEYFRTKGFDGIAYRSSLGSGHCIAIFETSSADVINGSIYQVNNVHFDFSEAGNPYVLQRH